MHERNCPKHTLAQPAERRLWLVGFLGHGAHPPPTPLQPNITPAQVPLCCIQVSYALMSQERGALGPT